MNATLPAVAFSLLGILVCETASALPRFASRTAAKCQSCHVNPSGGGIRQTFGVTYGRDELPVPTWSDEFGLDDFSTNLTDFVSVGADFRTLFFYQQIPDTGLVPPPAKSNNAFWQMQGDVYMNFRLAKRVSIYIDKGIYSGFEIFGLLNILPAHGFIKVGKFVPNYGTKLDDHTAYVRNYTGFSAERGRAELTGGEIGFSPGPVTITGGVFNAADGFGAGTGNQKAFLGRAEGIFKATEEIAIGLGGNVFTRKSAAGVRTTLLGGFGSFSYQNLTIFGEGDLVETKAGGVKVTALIAYIEADFVVTPGLDVKFAYDFYDPDKDFKTGAMSRYSFGFEFFPLSGVEVRPIYRLVKEDPTDVKNDEFHLLIHFYL
ncbi:MAG: hypothetical protein HY708_07250 [Ignavibacteriae bacterium]|nr:hypothetical protein [Ignavibacteriota bacterium]